MQRLATYVRGSMYTSRVAGPILILLAAASCSGRVGPRAADATIVVTDQFKAFACDPQADPEQEPAAAERREAAFRGQEFSLATPADYFAMLQAMRFGPAVAEAERGLPCAGAADRAACKQRLDRLLSTVESLDSAERAHMAPYLVTTTGDDLKLWRAAELSDALRPIDTPAEAWLMLRIHHDLAVPTCGVADESAYRAVRDGYELRERHADKTCPPFRIHETRYHVGTDGSVRLLDDRIVSSRPGGCMVS